ncbi:hypothetical protein [Brevibacillus sp. H7]|uniref:hypothetical protein n=1 Tax=Brevibacillus sp. H7 TaxID=3349138 RepID=UPI003826F493
MFVRLMLALVLVLLLPSSAFAYSYGDPNKEELAETYKEIAAKLQKNPADWNGAYQAFVSRKKEIALEFGDKTAQQLEANFANKQKELALHNYKAVLVMNIDRRLDNAEKQFGDYAKAKLLLAKGRGTLDVLAPYLSDHASKTAYTAFDHALKALGNPGLFGVGTVPSDKNEFVKQTALIRSALKPLFQLKSANPGPAAEPTPSKSTAPQGQSAKPSASTAAPATATSSKPAAQAPQSTPRQTGTAKPASAASNSSATPASGDKQPDTSTAAGQTAASPTPAAVAQSETPPASMKSSPAQSDTSSQQSSAASAQPAAEQTVATKVNPLVTLSVIGGLAIAVGAAFWIAKRKGLI